MKTPKEPTPKEASPKKTTDRPMKVVGRKYARVSDMVRDTSDAEFATEFGKFQADRRLINGMTVIRCSDGVSQTELADRMNCTQSKVSKMESSVDADLSFGDILGYARGLKHSIHIMLSPRHQKRADHIRFHIECIKHELSRLVKFAGEDKDIGDGVETFAIQQVQSFLKIVEETLDKLPHRVPQSNSDVSVEIQGKRGERLSIDRPKRARMSTRKPSPVS